MLIKILGSGTILSKKRNPSAYLIKSDNQIALIDCGPGIFKRLIDLNIDATSLSALFLSHFHIDHYSDVLPILMRRYLKNHQINRNLTIFGPIGLKYWFKTQSKMNGNWFSDNKPLLIEMRKSETTWADLTVKSFPTAHTENSIAFKFIKDKNAFFYSSDTDYNSELVSFAKNSTLAILECSHRDESYVKGHLTPQSVAEFINNAKLENTFLTHIYPENDTSDLLERVKDYTDKNIQIAFDFMEMQI